MKNFKKTILKQMILTSNQRLILPFYHKVSDDKPTFSKHLYTPKKSKDFKNDLAILCKYYNPISLPKLLEVSKSKSKINTSQNFFHLTFDDGLSNFYNIVAPILLEKKIPATIFVNSDFIDNKALFYRYKASLLYQFYQQASEKLKLKFYNFFEEKGSVKEKLFAINFNNKDVLDHLAIEVNYSFENYLATKKPYLTSGQIEELIALGFTIGAHSKNHPLYSDIEFEEQIIQTKISIDFLIKRFNLNYKIFSFPFTDLGVSKAFFTTLYNDGYLDASFGTSGIKNDTFQTHFQRIDFEINTLNAENFLLQEYSKFFLKIILNKNTISRN